MIKIYLLLELLYIHMWNHFKNLFCTIHVYSGLKWKVFVQINACLVWYIHAFILYKMQLLYIFISHAMGLNMKIMNPVVCSQVITSFMHVPIVRSKFSPKHWFRTIYFCLIYYHLVSVILLRLDRHCSYSSSK